MVGKCTALIGGQFGSEGKGVISAHLAHQYDVHVRTGGPNAGHTFKFGGDKIVMQTIPCGWINMDASLIIGVGALIDVDNLLQEIDLIKRYDPNVLRRLKIDAHAGIISETHHAEEGGIQGEMHKRIGSTGKGVGAARRDRVMRDPDKLQQVWQSDVIPEEVICNDTALYINQALDGGYNVMLEGTQGCGLDLVHGPWPYVTSNGCTAAQLAADAGVGPTRVTDVLLVARTFPIRVAGNSGPLSDETDWETISQRVGRPTVEQTTVTKKIRRIGAWDDKLFGRSLMLNDAGEVALTFLDYMFPEDEGKTSWRDLSGQAIDWIRDLEIRHDVTVTHIGTGGKDNKWHVIDR